MKNFIIELVDVIRMFVSLVFGIVALIIGFPGQILARFGNWLMCVAIRMTPNEKGKFAK